MTDLVDTYISVDIEAAGPIPSEYALLSIGACLVADPDRTFYVELQPDSTAVVESALAISGLSLQHLTENGIPPLEAMENFEAWIDHVTTEGGRPVCVAFNAPFDWMFINEYFHRYLGRNPFGHSALDIKAYYMGLSGSNWNATRMVEMRNALALNGELSHQALEDAIEQAYLFQHMLNLKDENSDSRIKE